MLNFCYVFVFLICFVILKNMWIVLFVVFFFIVCLFFGGGVWLGGVGLLFV